MSGELYTKYLAALDATAFDGRYVTHEPDGLPKSLHITWMAYRAMLEEFSREISNSLNDLTNYTHRLKAWGTVISPMPDQEKLDATHEFIDPLATVSLTLPYVIQSRFIFAAAHLCHQANRSRDDLTWKDNLRLDRKIVFQDANKHGSNWASYDALKGRIEAINDEAYRDATHDFRHAYNHRFSPRVVIGLTQFVRRQVDAKTKAVSYVFGYLQPLTLDVITELLTDQCQRGYAAFDAFQDLVRDHAKSISEPQIKESSLHTLQGAVLRRLPPKSK